MKKHSENKILNEEILRSLLLMHYDKSKTLLENKTLLMEEETRFYFEPFPAMLRDMKGQPYWILSTSNTQRPSDPSKYIYAKDIFPTIKDGKYPDKISFDEVLAYGAKKPKDAYQSMVSRDFVNTIQRYSPNYWKGKPEPKKPTPYNGTFISSSDTRLPKQPWGYYEGKLGNYDEQMKQYEIDFDLWQEVNDPEGRINRLRVTAKGRNVPENFYPGEYDQYIDEIQPCLNKQEELKNKYSKKIYPPSDAPGVDNDSYQYEFDMNDMTPEDRKTYDDCSAFMSKIYEKYYTPDFRYGISFKDRKTLEQYSKALSDYWIPKIAACEMEHANDPYGDIYSFSPKITYRDEKGNLVTKGGQSKGREAKECIAMRVNYNSQIEGLKKYYGYDFRSEFDKIWDDWGGWIQVGGSLLLLLTGPYAPFLDAAFNLSIAGYQLSRDQFADAGVSVLFAFLPAIGSAFKIGKIPTNISKSISQKLANANVKTSADLADFMMSLSKEEKPWFNAFVKNTPQELQRAVAETAVRYAEKTGAELSPKLLQSISKEVGKKSVKKALAKGAKVSFKWPLGRRISFDLTTIFTGQQFADVMERMYYEENKEKMEEESRKFFETFFDTIPKEVREQVISQMSPEDVINVGEGNIESATDSIYNREYSKPDGSKYSQKELDDFKKQQDDAISKYYN